MQGSEKGRPLGHDEIFELIEVRPPYFALEELTELAPGVVQASLQASVPVPGEEGPIGSAQAGRHLAILGSIGAALQSEAEGRHFYLAYDAEYRRARSRPDPTPGQTLLATTRSHFLDPGTAVALCDLRTTDGTAIATLSVYYMVVAESDFRGLFAQHALPDGDFSDRPDPYESTKPVGDVSVWDTRLFTSLGEITPYDCQGHFEGLPAMPVAYLMGNLVARSIRLAETVLDRQDLTAAVREASVRAENLAFAGETVDCHLEYQRFAGGTHWFHCAAIADGHKPVGKLHLKLRVRD